MKELNWLQTFLSAFLSKLHQY